MEGRIYSALYSYSLVDDKGVSKGNFSAVLGLFSSQEKAEKYINDFFYSDSTDKPQMWVSKSKTHLHKVLVIDVREMGNENDGFVTETRELIIEPYDVDVIDNPLDDIYHAHCRKYAKYDF